MTINERATRYVATMPAAISGSGGHKAIFAVAVTLRYGFDLSEDEAWPIMLEYNRRCEPPWSEKELRHKLHGGNAVSRHSKARGYLRGAMADKVVAIDAPLLRFKTWKEILAEVVPNHAALITSGAPAKPAKPAKPPTVEASGHEPSAIRVDVVAMAIRIFNATTPSADELDSARREQLRLIENILKQRDGRGCVAFTTSQIESCYIGLRGFAGEHPDVDAMLRRLIEAKKEALTWRELARRKYRFN